MPRLEGFVTDSGLFRLGGLSALIGGACWCLMLFYSFR
jgi:hypothetical protein